MNGQIDRRELRRFGLLVGSILVLIGVWLTVSQGLSMLSVVIGLGTGLIVLGWLHPPALQQVYRGWMTVGHVLGWINTRIILGVIFYGLITPMGFAMRVMGKDFMRRSSQPEAASYRVPRVARPASHVRRQF
jgi:polyferredoxin